MCAVINMSMSAQSNIKFSFYEDVDSIFVCIRSLSILELRKVYFVPLLL